MKYIYNEITNILFFIFIFILLKSVFYNNKECIPIWNSSYKNAIKYLDNLSQNYNVPFKLECNENRNEVVYEIIKNIVNKIKSKNKIKFLDFGGVNNKLDLPIEYECLNLKECTGTTCFKTKCSLYDGKIIPYKTNSFDIILSDFVLHHTSENAISLLSQLYNICSKYMIIGEDISSLYASKEWQTTLFNHDPNGVFRSIKEWINLFKLINFRLEKVVCLSRVNCEYKGKKCNIGGGPGMVYFILKK